MRAIATSPSFGSVLRDLIALTKPRVTLLVIATTACGFWLAPGAFSVNKALLTLLFTAMVVSGANALNCWLERDTDALMARTRTRPVPAGRLDARVALGFGATLAVISVPALMASINVLTGLLAALALVSYVGVYTPLKERTPKALLVGAVPGAIPPLLGWTAVTGKLDVEGIALFLVLFFWQLPHFLAIAIYRKQQYMAAGIRVLPAVRGDRAAQWHATGYAVLLVPVTLALWPLGLGNVGYFVVAAVLGALLLGWCVYGLMSGQAVQRWARALFLASNAYLVLLVTSLVVSHV